MPALSSSANLSCPARPADLPESEGIPHAPRIKSDEQRRLHGAERSDSFSAAAINSHAIQQPLFYIVANERIEPEFAPEMVVQGTRGDSLHNMEP